MKVAIDGPAGAGKSTIAKKIAENINYFYLNSGNFYRAVTYAVLKENVDPENEKKIIGLAKKCRIRLLNGNIYLDGDNIDHLLHSDKVDKWVAQHSAIIKVRKIVNKHIRKATKGMDIVAEGRDMSTVVFPDAEVKIFLDASLEIRTKRRFDQGVSGMDMDKIQNNLKTRDSIDTSKPFGKLERTDDAVYIDSSDLTIEEVCEKVQGKIIEVKKQIRSK